VPLKGRASERNELGGDDFEGAGRLACRFAVFLGEFAFGADPVFERIAGSAIALEKNFVGADLNFFGCGMLLGGTRLARRGRSSQG